MVEAHVLSGLDDKNIDFMNCEVPLHQGLAGPVARLRERALAAGFELGLASGYRSFERQLHIWNAKAEGERPVLDDQGQPLDVSSLSAEARMFAILRWSALPGASRHHWGTDVDVFDAGPSRRDGYKLQLTFEETQPGGIYEDFHRWLSAELARGDSGFFRPYTRLRGGVAPEPWHLSYAPVARQYQQSLSADMLRELFVGTDIALKEVVLEHFNEIFERFVWVRWEDYPLP